MISQWDMSRLVVGILCVVVAILVLVNPDYSTAGAVAFAVLGLITVATARRR